MVIQLFGHPFSSYTWKAKIALYESDTPFSFRMIDPDYPENCAEIIEYLAAVPGRVKLIASDPKAAVKVRMMDRVFDSYVMNVLTTTAGDALRPRGTPRPLRRQACPRRSGQDLHLARRRTGGPQLGMRGRLHPR
jgi:glutathione S-transferase